MSYRLVSDLDVAEKAVFCRVDFNVPLDGNSITDDRRILAALPTLRWLLERGAKVVCASHLGRPKGAVRPELSLAPVAQRLSELLEMDVPLAGDCVGPAATSMLTRLVPGRVGLLENLRLHAAETKGDDAFATQLAVGFDAFVGDAFGAAHRAHASVAMVPGKVAERAAGFLMDAEIKALTRLIGQPERPYFAILGGAKVSDKIALIDKLLEKVDGILIGGAMAYTFLAARGIGVGASRVEADRLDLARELETRAAEKNVAIHLPVDHLVAHAIDGKTLSGVESTDDEAIGDGLIGVDIGPKTIERFREVLAADAKTVLWNGPVGFFEASGADIGTRALAEHLAAHDAFSVLGGGDTAAAARVFGLEDRYGHVSTGGGAALELLSGVELPGVSSLER